MKIVHLVINDKFIQPYIDFINKNFDGKDHYFYVVKDKNLYTIEYNNQTIYVKGVKWIKLIVELYKSNKIILHGLWNNKENFLLMINPNLLKKSYWVIWGRDLYWYKLRERNLKNNIFEFFRRRVIKKIAYIVTGNIEDFKLAKKWYNSKAIRLDTFSYPSNCFNNFIINNNKIDKHSLNILIGNSADTTNRHKEIFEILRNIKEFSLKDIKLFVPLSYAGDSEYIKDVIDLGKKFFKGKFTPLLKFLKYEEYLNLLNNMDIAIFYQKDQQSFGNIIQLLGMGKKVYISKYSNLNVYFKKLGIQIYNVENGIDLSFLESSIRVKNMNIISSNFTEENLAKSWNNIFYNRGIT